MISIDCVVFVYAIHHAIVKDTFSAECFKSLVGFSQDVQKTMSLRFESIVVQVECGQEVTAK